MQEKCTCARSSSKTSAAPVTRYLPVKQRECSHAVLHWAREDWLSPTRHEVHVPPPTSPCHFSMPERCGDRAWLCDTIVS
eukprot:1147514-Pelagomonas_calceolata.AAC.8